MASIKTILAPVDFSENSRVALGKAAELAADLGAQLIILHVVADSALRAAVREGLLCSDDNDESLRAKVEALSERRMREFLEPLGDAVAGTERVVRHGEPSRTVVEYARTTGVDLVVMGRRGVTLGDVLLGSVAERVVRHAPCPVMVVRLSTPS